MPHVKFRIAKANLTAARSRLGAFIRHRTVVWLVLALPAFVLIWPMLSAGRMPPRFLNQSGEWAMRLLILTLALTPLQRLFRTSRFIHWLARQRRYFGVASFLYAVLHVGFYLWQIVLDWGPGAWTRILFTAVNLFAWSGWLAFGLMLPLAATSNDKSRRQLGRWWKPLQRLTYVLAIAAAVHWVLLAGDWSTWAQVGGLVLLEAARLGLPLLRRPNTSRR